MSNPSSRLSAAITNLEADEGSTFGASSAATKTDTPDIDDQTAATAQSIGTDRVLAAIMGKWKMNGIDAANAFKSVKTILDGFGVGAASPSARETVESVIVECDKDEAEDSAYKSFATIAKGITENEDLDDERKILLLKKVATGFSFLEKEDERDGSDDHKKADFEALKQVMMGLNSDDEISPEEKKLLNDSFTESQSDLQPAIEKAQAEDKAEDIAMPAQSAAQKPKDDKDKTSNKKKIASTVLRVGEGAFFIASVAIPGVGILAGIALIIAAETLKLKFLSDNSAAKKSKEDSKKEEKLLKEAKAISDGVEQRAKLSRQYLNQAVSDEVPEVRPDADNVEEEIDEVESSKVTPMATSVSTASDVGNPVISDSSTAANNSDKSAAVSPTANSSMPSSMEDSDKLLRKLNEGLAKQDRIIKEMQKKIEEGKIARQKAAASSTELNSAVQDAAMALNSNQSSTKTVPMPQGKASAVTDNSR